MKFRDRELKELRKIYAAHIKGSPEVPLAAGSKTEIDLDLVNVTAMHIAQGRVLGAMLDELLAAKAVPKRKRPLPARRG